MNQASAAGCECGYDFDAPVDVAGLLRSRRTTGWMMVVGGLVLAMVSLLSFMFVGFFAFFGIVPAVGAFVKGTRIIDGTTRQMRAQQALPVARKVERPDS